MKRKVIQLASRTLVISLPASWASAFNIKKGDELNVEEKGSSLVFSKISNSLPLNSINLDCSKGSASMLWYKLVGAYITGFNEIIIRFKESIDDIREKHSRNSSDYVEDICSYLVGFEVIKQSSTSATLQEVSKSSSENFNSTLRRIFLTIKSFSELKDLSQTDKFETRVNRLSIHLLRLLNTLPDFANKSEWFVIIQQLEEVADEFKKAQKRIKASSELKDLHDVFALFNTAFYSGKEQDLSTFHSARQELKDKVTKNMDFLNSLKVSAVDKMMSILHFKMMLDMKGK